MSTPGVRLSDELAQALNVIIERRVAEQTAALTAKVTELETSRACPHHPGGQCWPRRPVF